MSSRIRFHIWYADGTIGTGTSVEDWIGLADEGVLVVQDVTDVIYRNRHCCERFAGEDYYWVNADGSFGGGSAKKIPAEARAVKRGQAVDAETWDRIYNQALIDPLVQG